MDRTSHLAPPLSSDVKPSPTRPFLERELAQKSTFPMLPPDRHERVKEIFWEVIDSLGDGVSWRFLVHWPGRLLEDDVWISEADLQQLRSDLWEPLLYFFVPTLVLRTALLRTPLPASTLRPSRLVGLRSPKG